MKGLMKSGALFEFVHLPVPLFSYISVRDSPKCFQDKLLGKVGKIMYAGLVAMIL